MRHVYFLYGRMYFQKEDYTMKYYISLTSRKGQGAVEYAIITVAVIAVLALLLLPGMPFGAAIAAVFTRAGTLIGGF